MIVLKITAIVLLAVLGLVIVLLLLPLRAQLSFIGEEFEYKVKYAFINIIDSGGGGIARRFMPENGKDKGKSTGKETGGAKETGSAAGKKEKPEAGKSAEKSEKEKTPDKSAKEKTTDKPEKDETGENGKTLGDKVGFLMDIWHCAKHPARRLFKGFHITQIYIDFVVADEDAYKCALNYGRISGLVYNALAQISNFFTADFKSVDIVAGFAKDKSKWDAGANVTFLPFTAVIAGIWFLVTYLFRVYLPNRRNEKKAAKTQRSSRKAECEV